MAGEKSEKGDGGMRYLSLFSGIEACTVAWHDLGWQPVAFAEFDDFPKAVLHYHYPNVPDLGDVTKITEEQIKALGPIDLVVGGSPCFGAGTMVLTKEGYKPIEQIKVGDLVYTHKHRWMPVLRVGGRIAQTFVLKVAGFPDTVVTANHPFPARLMHRHYGHDENRRGFRYRTLDDSVKTRVEEFKKTFTYLSLPKLQTSENPFGLTKKDCWLIGRFIADGHSVVHESKDGSMRAIAVFSIGDSKKNSFEEHIKDYRYKCYTHTKSTWRFELKDDLACKILDLKVGNGALNKRISQILLDLPADLLEEVLLGYWSGDGCVIDGKWQAITVSKELAMSLCLAVAKTWNVNANVGFSKRPPKYVIEGRTVNQHDTWTIRFHPRGKADRQRNAFIEEKEIWSAVRSVTPLDIRPVYNIEVEEDHTYVANNMVTMNCQDLSVAGKRAGLRNDDGSLTRSGLFDHQMRIFEIARKHNGCRFCLWENVPGSFSSNEGRDFAYILGTMVDREIPVPRDGWKNSGVCVSESGDRIVEWRVLDSQYVGEPNPVPQRRRRVFALLDSGAWWSRPPILFERQGMPGDSLPCEEAWQGAAGCPAPGSDEDCSDEE